MKRTCVRLNKPLTSMQPVAVGAGVDGDAVPVRGPVEEGVAGIGEDRRRPARHSWGAEGASEGTGKRAVGRKARKGSRGRVIRRGKFRKVHKRYKGMMRKREIGERNEEKASQRGEKSRRRTRMGKNVQALNML